ncbi:MAG: clostripain-related cysteine peptidase [Elusimicrobiales bacterium]|nr:clostripain-related cysteine peptidase [Elusimicrobiales bacterium]
MKLLSTLAIILLSLGQAHAGPALDTLNGLAPQAPAAAPAPKADLKEWTIMVYMNGKSNIEPFALADLNRFETAGSSDKINIVAEIGRSKGLDNDTTADGDWTGVRRYFVTRDADPDHIASPLLADLGARDMGDWRQAADFVKWARAAYPAKKYALIIWDHGWGWLDPVKPGENLLDEDKSISHDFVTGNYIGTRQLGRIFRDAGKVDLYVSMACFMQMAEVAYEIKDGADVIVGAEEVIQLPSLNWEGFLAALAARPAASAEKAGVYLVDTFKEMYSRPEMLDLLQQGGYGTQLSAIRGAKLRGLAQKLKDWYTPAMAAGDKAAFARAKAEVVRFEIGDPSTDPQKLIAFYGDLHHFVELHGRYADKSLPGAAQALAAGERLNRFISSELVIKNAAIGKDRTGKAFDSVKGLAINIPGRPGTLIEYYPTYSKLYFAQDSGWETFMKYLETIEPR